MEYVRIVRALALSTLAIPSNETTTTFHLLHPSTKVDLPPFCQWFPFKNQGYFRLGNIYFHFSMFATSFIYWFFKYDVWTFMKLFCPRLLYEWLSIFFWGMWAHCSRSYFHICTTFAYKIITTNCGKIYQWHLAHHEWKCHLLTYHPHTRHSFQKYIHGIFYFSPIWCGDMGWMWDNGPWWHTPKLLNKLKCESKLNMAKEWRVGNTF